MLIYQIKNKINNKIYIGQTIQSLNKRWRSHIWECTTQVSNMAITKAIVKYGVANFDITVICEATSQDDLNNKEIYYIKYFNSMTPNGYNLTSGGRVNYIISDETRKKISNSNKGHFVSEETRKKLSESHMGHVVSEETKLKLSIINKNKTIPDKVRIAASIKSSKTYILLKNNVLYVITNMRKFAKENNHQITNLSSLATGKIEIYKGFKLISNLDKIETDKLEPIVNNFKFDLQCENVIYFSYSPELK